MFLMILTTPGGEVPALYFELGDPRLEEGLKQHQSAVGFTVYTLTHNDDDSLTAHRDFHLVNRTAFLLLDESSGDPVFDGGTIEVTGLHTVFRGPSDFEEADEDTDYPTDINEMSDEQIASRTIR